MFPGHELSAALGDEMVVLVPGHEVCDLEVVGSQAIGGRGGLLKEHVVVIVSAIVILVAEAVGHRDDVRRVVEDEAWTIAVAIDDEGNAQEVGRVGKNGQGHGHHRPEPAAPSMPSGRKCWIVMGLLCIQLG